MRFMSKKSKLDVIDIDYNLFLSSHQSQADALQGRGLLV